MDLTHLKYFRTVASCGSLSAAARALGVSQPTLTAAMKSLEESFGTTLLYRERNGVTLTSPGQVLLHHAHEVFAVLERCEREIRGLETQEVGSFVVGCHESLGAYFLPGFLSNFLREAPQINVALWNGTSKAVQQAVLAREVHFGLVVNAPPQPDLVIVPLFEDAVDFFVRAEDALPPGAPASLAEERVRNGPLIHAGRVIQSQELIEDLSRRAMLPARMLSCGDLELVKSLTLAGIGVGLLPRRVAAYGQHEALVRLHPEMPFVPDVISLIYRADTHQTRAAKKLKDALREHGKRLPPP